MHSLSLFTVEHLLMLLRFIVSTAVRDVDRKLNRVNKTHLVLDSARQEIQKVKTFMKHLNFLKIKNGGGPNLSKIEARVVRELFQGLLTSSSSHSTTNEDVIKL